MTTLAKLPVPAASRVALVAAFALACSAAPASAPTPGETAPAVGQPIAGIETPEPGAPAALVAEFDAGGDGWAMTKAGSALWIQVDPPVDAIVRIDIVTGQAVPVVQGGIDAKSGPEGLWVVCCDGLARLDPVTGQKQLELRSSESLSLGALALADGFVWSLGDRGLVKLDPGTGKAIGEPIGLAVDPSACEKWGDLMVAAGSAWLACKEGKILRIEIPSGRMTSIETGDGAHSLAATDGSVWVTNYRAASVSRIDTTSNEATRINGAGSGVGITAGGGYVWASADTGIAKIDPATTKIVTMIDLGPGQYYELVWDDGIIWASTRGHRVLKVDPTKQMY